MKKIINFVGPLPPPIHGESLMLRKTKEILQDSNKYNIVEFNTGIGRSNNEIKNGEKIKNDLSLIINLLKSKRKHSILYVSISQTKMGLIRDSIMILISSFKNHKIITHLHGNNLSNTIDQSNNLLKYLFKSSLKKVDTAIALSVDLEKNYLNLPINSTFIHNCIEEGIEANINEIQLKKNKEKDILYVTYLSNLLDDKGYFELFEAVKLINEKDSKLKIILNVAGKIMSIKSKEILEEYQSYEWFNYNGIIDGEDKRLLLIKSDVICLPSYYKIEAEPIVLIEALATGNIIVSTNRAAIPEIMGECNFFVEERSVDSIQKALIRINNLSSKHVSNIIEENYKRYLKKYSQEIYKNKILELFNR